MPSRNLFFAHTLCAFVAANLLLPSPVFAQDAGKALGSFSQNILIPQRNAPSRNNDAANALGNLLDLSTGSTANKAQANNANDVVGMLSQSLEDFDEPKEIELGRQLAAVLLGAKPLHPNMALQGYVNRLGRWISLQSPRPNLPWTFAVLDDPGFNAFAAPGGYVFVTNGLIERVADESELAGILAHEISHVVVKHHLKALRKNARAGLLSQVVASQVGNSLPGGMTAQLLGMGRNLYSKGLDQEDELDADRTGVSLAARAGFDPYGLVAVLPQLRTATVADPLFALTVSTHPSAQVRLDQLELAMGQRLDALVGRAPITAAHRLARTGNR